MPQVRGRRIGLSPARRFICDMMAFSRGVPAVPIERRTNVAPLAAARHRLKQRPGWSSLFIKAYACVAARHPELRRVYMPFPWPHLYEHPINIAAVSVERLFGEEIGVLAAPLLQPENQPLPQLDQHLQDYKTRPLQSCAYFRRIWNLCRFPFLIRRLLWWWGLNSSGRRRSRHFGTFGVSSVGGFGAGLLCVLSPLTTVLSFGPVDQDGNVDVRLTFDHRVLDGAEAARVLAELEQVLSGEILQEVIDLVGCQSSIAC
jgi:hypothetical protein